MTRPLALVTGASTGIGYELALLAAENGFDLVIAANEPRIEDAARSMRAFGAEVTAVEVELSTVEGIDGLVAALDGRTPDALFANAGAGLGHAFLDQDFAGARHVVDTNITGTLYLLHTIGRRMRQRGSGRILVTGSIAGTTPGPFHAIYNATKAFIDNFTEAFRNELGDSGVTVTCLMPGATETSFFDRAELRGTVLGEAPKDDAAMVAKTGFEAMMRGEASVVAGLKNKLAVAVCNITPASFLAEQHRKAAKPGSAGN